MALTGRAWLLQHVDRSLNHEAHDVACREESIQVCAVRVQEPLYKGREYLSNVKAFLLTEKVPVEVPKEKRDRFVKTC